MSSGKKRLDVALAQRGLVATRSQAESYIKLGKVKVNGKILNPAPKTRSSTIGLPTATLGSWYGAGKSGYLVSDDDKLEIIQEERYVSRAALKLDSVARKLGLDFNGKVILDVGSSTGGFTDYALQNGAQKVIAVDVGTDQLHQSLRTNPKIELHEKTDIRDFKTKDAPDIILIDVSFISLRQVLPAVEQIAGKDTQIAAMLKPQFEASPREINKGVIKNDTVRRKILGDFETWAKQHFIIWNKADSEVTGAKGNRERFYLLTKI